VLSELSLEVKEKQTTLEKQKRETSFLRQKNAQYNSQVTAMKVTPS